MNEKSKLLDREALGEIHPAFKNKWRVDWLIRTRGIPVVLVGRRIFFDEAEIQKWIQAHSVQAQKGGRKA